MISGDLVNALVDYVGGSRVRELDDGESVVWHFQGRQFKVTITEIWDYPNEHKNIGDSPRDSR